MGARDRRPPAAPTSLGAKARDLRGNASHRGPHVSHHELRADPNDRVPRANESPITACIGRHSGGMMKAVHFDHETHLGGKQVSDEPTEHGNLPTE